MATKICAACGTTGTPKTHTPGSILIELLAWFCFALPGMIYSVWRLTNRREVCPKCEAPGMIPLDTPRGRQLAAASQAVRVLVAALMLSACSVAPGPAGPPGPQGPAGEAADSSMLVALMQRVTELEKREAKVPWFVDGETKEPIGRVLDYGDRIAWSDEIGAPVTAYAVPVYYAEADCRGEARVDAKPGVLAILADGSIGTVTTTDGGFEATSTLTPRKGCANAAPGAGWSYRRFAAAAGSLPPVPFNLLSVEAR